VLSSLVLHYSDLVDWECIFSAVDMRYRHLLGRSGDILRRIGRLSSIWRRFTTPSQHSSRRLQPLSPASWWLVPGTQLSYHLKIAF